MTPAQSMAADIRRAFDEASAKDSGARLMKIMVNQSQAKWIEDGLGVLPPYFEVYQPMPLLHGEIGRFEWFKIRTMADPAPDRLLGSTLAPIPPHRLKYPCAPRSRGV